MQAIAERHALVAQLSEKHSEKLSQDRERQDAKRTAAERPPSPPRQLPDGASEASPGKGGLVAAEGSPSAGSTAGDALATSPGMWPCLGGGWGGGICSRRHNPRYVAVPEKAQEGEGGGCKELRCVQQAQTCKRLRLTAGGGGGGQYLLWQIFLPQAQVCGRG